MPLIREFVIIRVTSFKTVKSATTWFGFGFCGPWILRSSDGSSLIWDITSSPRGVEPPSTRQLEFQTAWDKGGILRPVLS